MEPNEKQVVVGTTCEKPSKARTDEKGLKEKKVTASKEMREEN